MKRIALIGMPNTGKSTLFNRLTGAHARVGNWPGITVDLLSAKILLGDQMVQIVDLPGIYDLRGYADDERIVTSFLGSNRVELALVVINASQIDRQLGLLGQIARLGVPAVVVLNMADEAAAMGITVNGLALTAKLGVPVCLVSAKYGHGMEQLHTVMLRGLRDGIAPLGASGQLAGWDDAGLAALANASVFVPAQASHALTEKIDRVLLAPWLGLPIFFGVMFVLFEAIFWLGKPVQDALTAGFSALRALALEPALASLPPALNGLLLDGVYNGLSTIAQQIDWVQAYSFMLFTLIYTPCLSTVATLRSEAKSPAFTALAVAWPLGLAWLASFVFYQSARHLGA